MELIVIEKTEIAEDTVRIRFAPFNDTVLLPFEPGAHIELSFSGYSRRYSLTSDPERLDSYEICVLRTRRSRGGSEFIHDILAVGDSVSASGPNNGFPLDLNAPQSIFFAGGIGITPFYSMMATLSRAGKPFALHYAARDSKRFLAVPDFVKDVSYYTNDSGRPTLDVRSVLSSWDVGTDIYVCGPRPLIESVRLHASELGWSRDRVHFESFGATVKATDKPVSIRLAHSDLTIKVQPGTTILDALLENDIWAPYECRRGECASCAIEVSSGTPDHRDFCLDAGQRRKHMCVCVSWAHSDKLELNL